jgi:hypothetical protein
MKWQPGHEPHERKQERGFRKGQRVLYRKNGEGRARPGRILDRYGAFYTVDVYGTMWKGGILATSEELALRAQLVEGDYDAED